MMFRFIKKVFIVAMFFSANTLVCVSMNNQRTKIIDINNN